MSAHAVPLNPNPATANEAVTLTEDSAGVVPTALYGWSLAESAGATAKARIHDGTSASGPVLAVITFAASANSQVSLANPILIVNGAVYLEIVSGSVEGCIHLG